MIGVKGIEQVFGNKAGVRGHYSGFYSNGYQSGGKRQPEKFHIYINRATQQALSSKWESPHLKTDDIWRQAWLNPLKQAA
jgi:hypothetical protein